MEKYENISILVSSCDKFRDAWDPFFRLLEKYWPNHPKKVFLNSETKEYDNKTTCVKTILNDPHSSWTERVRKTVHEISTEYVLFFLEDYFIWNEVDEVIFDQALNILEKESDVGAVVFHGVSRDSTYNTNFNCDKVFVEQSKNIISRAHVVVTLFRRDYLLRMLCANENPWRYERESYARSIALGKRILAQNYGYSAPCFLYYLKPRDNIGINQGKWLKDTIPMFEKNGIVDIDYDNLGVYSEYLKPNRDQDKEYISHANFKELIYSKVIKKLKYSMVGRRIKALYYKLYYYFHFDVERR